MAVGRRPRSETLHYSTFSQISASRFLILRSCRNEKICRATEQSRAESGQADTPQPAPDTRSRVAHHAPMASASPTHSVKTRPPQAIQLDLFLPPQEHAHSHEVQTQSRTIRKLFHMIRIICDRESCQLPVKVSLFFRHFIFEIQATAVNQHADPNPAGSQPTMPATTTENQSNT